VPAPSLTLITGAAGTIGGVLRAGLARPLRLTDAREPADLRADEAFVAADLADRAAIDRAVAGVDAVVHLGAIATEAAFDDLAGPNLHGAFNVFDACRRHGVRRVVFASSNHATGMYPAGAPLDETVAPRPDTLYGVTKAYGEALGRLYADKFGLEVVCLRIGTFAPRPPDRRALSTWLSHGDGVRLVEAALSAADVGGFAIVYGVSANARSWWPRSDAARRIGYEPRDDAEAFAAELADAGERYERQGGEMTARDYGGWTRA